MAPTIAGAKAAHNQSLSYGIGGYCGAHTGAHCSVQCRIGTGIRVVQQRLRPPSDWSLRETGTLRHRPAPSGRRSGSSAQRKCVSLHQNSQLSACIEPPWNCSTNERISIASQRQKPISKSARCNAALSVALPSVSDVDTWRLIIERATVFFAILVAHLAGSPKPSWRFTLPGRPSTLPSGEPFREPFLGSIESSVNQAGTADWGAEWGDQWDGATSAEQIAERRSTSESATTSETPSVFPPRIWGDVSDKLRAPPVARRGAVVETVLAKSPELSVQGLAREPRRRLLAAALGSLREAVELLPSEVEQLEATEWRESCEALLVDAVRGAKDAWLDEEESEPGLRKRVRNEPEGLRQRVRNNPESAAEAVSEDGPSSSGSQESAGESNWMQSLFRPKVGSQENQLESPASVGQKTSLQGGSGRQEDVPKREQAPRSEWGGWAGPVFLSKEGTDSSLGELPKELALMGEKLLLYEELLFYLRFKRCREGTRLVPGAFSKHAPRALEDLVLAIADAVASDCMSLVGYNPRVTPLTQEADSPAEGVSSATETTDDGLDPEGTASGSGAASGVSNKGESQSEGRLGTRLGEGLADQTQRVERLMQRYLHPRLRSTRALERFRNEVSFRRFLRTKLAAVSAMYEDRYDLWGLRRQPIAGASEPLEVPDSAGVRSDPRARRKPLPGFAGLGFLGRKRQATVAPEDWEVVVVAQSMPCRRIAELRRLGGWQLRYSMALEFLDVAAPILNALLLKLGDWISFLLVTMIGRSLGLIYKGIRQSLRRA